MSNRESLIQMGSEQAYHPPPPAVPPEKQIKLFHKNFNCSGHDHFPNNPENPDNAFFLWEADTYRYEFNLGMFFISLFIFFIDVTGLGFLIMLYELCSKSTFIHNLYQMGAINIELNGIGMMNTLFVIYSICTKNFIYKDANSLMFLVTLAYYSVIAAALNGYINSKIPPLMRKVKFAKESLENTGIFFDRKERSENERRENNGIENQAPENEGRENNGIENQAPENEGSGEFKRTVLRLNYDASSFFMTFFDKIRGQEDFKREPTQENRAQIKEEGHQLTLLLAPIYTQAGLVYNSLQFEYAVFNYKFLTKPSRFDENKAHGYRYAEKILEKFDSKSISYSYLFLFAAISTVALSYMRLDVSAENSKNFFDRYIVGGALLLINIVVTANILFAMVSGANVLWTRLQLIKGISELINDEEPPEDSVFRENCSMLNILDGESLRTWAGLRYIFMNMFQRKLDSISLAISLVVAIQAVIIAVLGFFYFTAGDSTQKSFFLGYIIFFGAPAVFYMMFVLLFIYVGAQVNKQYQRHIYLLKKLKAAVVKLFALYPNFTGNDPVQPTTYLYARGVKYLKDSFGNEEVKQEVLDERLGKISDAYDEVINDLENEEQYSPLKILGIPMTNSLVTTIFGFIATAVMTPLTKYISKITGM